MDHLRHSSEESEARGESSRSDLDFEHQESMSPDNLDKFKFGNNKDGKKAENLLDRYEYKDMEVIKEQNESVKNSELASHLNLVKMDKPKDEAHADDKDKEEQKEEGNDGKGGGFLLPQDDYDDKVNKKVDVDEEKSPKAEGNAQQQPLGTDPKPTETNDLQASAGPKYQINFDKIKGDLK